MLHLFFIVEINIHKCYSYLLNFFSGIIIGSIAAVIVIIIVLLMVSVKFRNRAIHQAKEGYEFCCCILESLRKAVYFLISCCVPSILNFSFFSFHFVTLFNVGTVSNKLKQNTTIGQLFELQIKYVNN